MAQVYGIIGSLSQVLYELKRNNITFLNSLDDIFSFENDFENHLVKIGEETSKKVLAQREELRQKIADLHTEYDSAISHNIFLTLFSVYRRYSLRKMKQKLDYMEKYIDTIIEDRTKSESQLFRMAKLIIEANKTTLIGATGEQKALNELKKLPDSFHIINDFKYEFSRWLHIRSSDEWIRSIQADHIVIGPTGVFVIETKNWNSNSIQNIDLYSPVEQIKRTNYALFRLLNRSVEHNLLSSFSHHWGSRKISVNSIILMVNKKPNQEFQYVKILSLNNLCGYITFSKPILTSREAQEIADFLLQRSR
ncbi:MAG: nuclease-related domain-containing protein [Chloroflexota bacterium]